MKRGRKIGWSLAAIVGLGIMVSILVIIGQGCGGERWAFVRSFETLEDFKEQFAEVIKIPEYIPISVEERENASFQADGRYNEKGLDMRGNWGFSKYTKNDIYDSMNLEYKVSVADSVGDEYKLYFYRLFCCTYVYIPKATYTLETHEGMEIYVETWNVESNDKKAILVGGDYVYILDDKTYEISLECAVSPNLLQKGAAEIYGEIEQFMLDEAVKIIKSLK